MNGGRGGKRRGGQRVLFLPFTTSDLTPFRLGCSSGGGNRRNPTNVASVCHQMLWGRCGSWTLHSGFEERRAALRSFSASSSHDPPRATYGYSAAVGSTTGPFDVPALANVL